MKKIKVLIYGVGVLGGLIAKFLLKKKEIEIVGAVDVDKAKMDKDLGEVLGLQNKTGVRVSDDLDSIVSKVRPHIAVHATSSYLRDTFPQIASIVGHGINVVSTCEELSYPYVSEPELSAKLNGLAVEKDVTILGTGINPGYLMDTLVITLTAPCQSIEKIEVARVMDAAKRRLPFQKKIGAGLSVAEFKEKIAKKHITGHVGLEQSIAMIADALAWKLQMTIIEPVEPLIADRPVHSEDIKVEVGKVAGLKQKAMGIMNGKEVVTLDFQAYIGAEEEHDAITISGIPEIRERISPCIHGDLATVAMVVNSIPKVIKAPHGLVTMKDLPIPSAVLEDMRKYLGSM